MIAVGSSQHHLPELKSCIRKQSFGVEVLNRFLFLLRVFGYTAGVRDLLCCRTPSVILSLRGCRCHV